MPFIEDFSPENIQARRITIALNKSTLNPKALDTVIFDLDYSGADTEGGIVLPLTIVVQAPTSGGYSLRHVFFSKPRQHVYRPISSGNHLITVRESGHNLFFGSLPFVVAGDPLDVSLARQ
jgi:hypothetical protein